MKMERLGRGNKGRLQGKQVDQNKSEILEPYRGLAISLRKYALKLNWGRMNFNTGVPKVYYLLPVTG